MATERAASRDTADAVYHVPSTYDRLDELADPSPVQNVDEGGLQRRDTLEHRVRRRSQTADAVADEQAVESPPEQPPDRPDAADGVYRVPSDYDRLDELAAPSPVQNVGEARLYRHETLEHRISEHEAIERAVSGGKLSPPEKPTKDVVSEQLTKLYTNSYLIFFSLLGTLARLGLQAITFYPGAPTVFGVLWANFGGSVVMGFLSEDLMLFKYEWGEPVFHQARERANYIEQNGGTEHIDLAAARKKYTATRKTIPLFIGLATGFCGSFTSFSSFIRDAYLAMSNELPIPVIQGGMQTSVATAGPRNGGYSFMALLAVIITTVSVSLGGLFFGAHLALVLQPVMPSFSIRFTRHFLDPLVVILGWGCWLGAVFLAIFPPEDVWRGRAVFALVFAPLGCLARFYVSLHLNGRIPSFPLGTFVVNVFGTVVLGMCWDLQHVPLGGVVGCQVLEGIDDGFCGCLTTVSTWVSELSSLRRRHAYVYGGASVVVSLAFLIIIMGSLQWTDGFAELLCSH